MTKILYLHGFASSAHSTEDEKYQQNKILTEWLESIFTNGAVEKKEMDLLSD